MNDLRPWATAVKDIHEGLNCAAQLLRADFHDDKSPPSLEELEEVLAMVTAGLVLWVVHPGNAKPKDKATCAKLVAMAQTCASRVQEMGGLNTLTKMLDRIAARGDRQSTVVDEEVIRRVLDSVLQGVAPP